MLEPMLWAVSAVALGLVGLAEADVKPYIVTQAEYNTECKTCPYSLCPNVVNYPDLQADSFNVTCWTHGTWIVDDDLWLKTNDGCYVTQYDVTDYAGDYTTDLAYCGPDSEIENLTTEDNTIKYKAECRICPDLVCEDVAYLSENTDVELNCYYPNGQTVIDDPFWLKTANNCYVSRKHLEYPPDLTSLANCGPVPLLEPEMHEAPSNNTFRKRDPAPLPVPQRAAYLINVTVGEDRASCRSCPKQSCDEQTSYGYNQTVWLQCVTDQGVNGTVDWWSETTDFCYVQDSNFWEDPSGDYYAMPVCEDFPAPDNGGDD